MPGRGSAGGGGSDGGGAARKLPFHVVYASSEDSNYPSSELNYHGPHTKGWMSASFVDFPQEIIIQFDEGEVSIAQIQILSHQSNIASKIELYVGVGMSLKDASYKRLGYLSLDNNERSGYKARELKSVYVDARGSFLKFALGRCYVNSQNLMNQVGVVAISVLGSAGPGAGGVAAAGGGAYGHAAAHHRKASSGMPPGVVGGGAPGGGGGGAMDDLAVDMSLDPETAAKLREVTRLKEEAVASEQYAKAKQYKLVQDNILRMGAKLAKLHAEKVEAVRSEDYDRAKDLKDEINHIRASILGVPAQQQAPPQQHYPPPAHAHTHHSSYGGGGGGPPPGGAGYDDPFGPDGGGGGPPHMGGGGGPGSPHRTMRDEYHPGPSPKHSLPGSARGRGPGSVAGGGGGAGGGSGAMAGGPPPGVTQQAQPSGNVMEMALPGNRGHNIYEQAAMQHGVTPGRPESRQLKPQASGGAEIAIERDDVGAAFGGGGGAGGSAGAGGVDTSQLDGVEGAQELPAPDAQSEAKARELPDVCAVVGDYIVRCFCSKTWGLRDAALQKIQLELNNYTQPPGTVLSAVCQLLQLAATKEKIAQVFLTSMSLLRGLVAYTQSMRRGEVTSALSSVTSAIVDKLGDNNARCRESSYEALVDMAHQKHIGCGFVASLVMGKLKKKQAAAWRPIKTRMELLRNLVEMFGLGGASGLVSDDLVRFTVDTKAYAHSKGEVRAAAMDLVLECFKIDGDAVRGMLGHLSKQQRAEYDAQFDAVSGGGGGGAAAAPGGGAPRGGGRGGGRGRGGASPKKRSSGGRGGGGRGGASGGGRGGGAAGAGVGSAAPAPAGEEPGPGGEEEDEEDETECQFCGWQYPENITDQALDLHYWQDCPVLTQCPGCQQVLEVSMVAEHLTTECEKQGQFGICKRCGESVKKAELKAHTAAKKCAPAKPETAANRCPLCHQDIPPGLEGWGVHLLDEGCPKNPRKLAAN